MQKPPLDAQLAAAIRRHTALHRRVAQGPSPDALAVSTLDELGEILEELRTVHTEMLDWRARLDDTHRVLHAQRTKYWDLFDDMPAAYLITDPDTVIAEANAAAGRLLNMSPRYLTGKPLSMFVGGDREQFLCDAATAAETRTPIELTFRLRPRERSTMSIAARVRGDGPTLRWVLRVIISLDASGMPRAGVVRRIKARGPVPRTSS